MAPDDALLKARAAATEATQELESFMYSVSHDLRAPLRSIDGFSQALMEDCGTGLSAECQRYLQHIRDSAVRMSQLMDGLLTLSRLSRNELTRTHVNLSRIARNYIDRLRAGDPSRAVDVIVPDGILADCDARLVTAALEHLLDNAWKFTSKSPSARIEFGIQPDAAPTTYYVRDNGAGFDMTYASRLFGVFQRLHSTEEFEGIGVGLAAVQKIARRHGGRTWAEGKPGEGATVYFTLG